MKRNILNSPRLLELKNKRRRVILNKILLSLLVFVVVFIVSVYISRVPAVNIGAIKIVGNKVVDGEAIVTSIEKQIAGNYLWVFPKRNILFYSKNTLAKELHSEFNRLKDINFVIKNGNNLEVSVTERTGLYTWCGNTLPEVGIIPTCYFMDELGYIFDEAPYFSGEVYFKFYGVASAGSSFSKENFTQLVDFKNTLTTLGLKPASLYVSDDGDIKIFLSSSGKTSLGAYVVFKKDDDFKKLTENLEAAIRTEPILSNLKNKSSSLEYIDLRFGNKVYYKFR